ncbi:DUF2207 domain-containing protein [Feifania hominis]|uniref:DUF2207 domain-containing protein n=1 Tax=Feifania hominis TaxID=2763660 RepID=A0A926HUA2_9FIRM|nr:DUF2207 domain-containing protein [Feifania hominis]MBC8535730.1 DUF2207 domain-containing protein [Feifania hominis]
MRQKKWILALVLALLFVFPLTAQAKSANALELTVDVTLQPDGSALVVEYLTMDFRGGVFRQGSRSIPEQGGPTITDVVVSENGAAYERLETAVDAGPQGSYSVERTSDGLQVLWHFRAEDEARTFAISYRINDIMTVYSDVAEFYYKVVGDEWDFPFERVSAVIHPPEALSADQVRAWAHGPLSGTVSILDNGDVSLSVRDLPSNTYVEARVTLPAGLFGGASIRVEEDGLPTILEQEQRLADEANAARAHDRILARINLFGAIFILVAGIGILVFMRSRFRRRRPALEPDYLRDLPSDAPPAELYELFYFYGGAGSKERGYKFTATILDLVLKRAIGLRDESTGKKPDLVLTNLGYETMDLKPYERTLLDYFFVDVARGAQEFRLRELKRYSGKHNQKTMEVFGAFDTQAKVAAGDRGYFDSEAGKKRVPMILMAVGMMFLGVICALFDLFFITIACVVIFLVAFVLTFTMRRLAQAGEDELALWKAFDRFVKDFSLLDEKQLPELIVWEKYLVYAMFMGRADELAKQLPLRYPQFADDAYMQNHFVYFYVFSHHGSGLDGFSRSFESISGAISGTISNAFVSSSGSGSGGGFSGGGGGGFGGGGGGFK